MSVLFYFSAWRLHIKPILCILNKVIVSGPGEGVCDIIFFNLLYAPGKGTFLDTSSAVLQWFLDYARNNIGSTQYGLGIDDGKEIPAKLDLETIAGVNVFRDFWSFNLRHYGLFKFRVHDALISSGTAEDYRKLLTRLKVLQDENRQGAKDLRGYLFLGIGLYAPRTGPAHAILMNLLEQEASARRSAPNLAHVLREQIMEHVVLRRINDFMERNQLFPHAMVGFRPHLSTQDVMLRLKHQIIDGEKSSHLDTRVILGLDFTKAFDNVRHDVVLENLQKLGVGR
ncbi:hypothetical protein ISCGN_026053 [Ixodes scapularis]